MTYHNTPSESIPIPIPTPTPMGTRTAEASVLGHGGITAVSEATGVSRRAIHAGIKELESKDNSTMTSSTRVRRPGAGRKNIVEVDITLVSDLEGLIEPVTRGDPESPLRWSCKSLRTLANELGKMGHKVSHTQVGKLLTSLGYSLQGNKKTLEGSGHPDRNAQFEYINTKVTERLINAEPVISVDTKKKELIGRFKNNGRTWRPKGQPTEVKVHDFIEESGRANPYGIYDIGTDEGWVSVGTDHDTAAFAVQTIRRWWFVKEWNRSWSRSKKHPYPPPGLCYGIIGRNRPNACANGSKPMA
jgi:hypothetical protein